MCNNLCKEERKMPTNLAIDDQLINTALKLGGHQSKKAAVTAALKEYIQHYQQRQILSLFGKIEYDPNYDYKKERKRK
jgi:Arc/MetJ family transcription regulator